MHNNTNIGSNKVVGQEQGPNVKSSQDRDPRDRSFLVTYCLWSQEGQVVASLHHRTYCDKSLGVEEVLTVNIPSNLGRIVVAIGGVDRATITFGASLRSAPPATNIYRLSKAGREDIVVQTDQVVVFVRTG